ncbi:phosphoglucosamine mutase [Thermodesulfobacteriota bacterium]
MGKLFGTDGIRGKANHYPMTPAMAVKIGMAVSFLCNEDGSRPVIVIGKDTRLSGDMLEAALVAGICSMGKDVCLTGILPTPGVAWMTSTEEDAFAGISISASHNPFYDNGIKIFSKDGFKLSEEKESEIEAWALNDQENLIPKPVHETGRVYPIINATERYAAFLSATVPPTCSFKGMKIIIDCANGATYRIAPGLFNGLGADTECFYDAPDGKNINANCGSEHPEVLKKHVIEKGADIGLAFDGDGDRFIAVDETGNIISGDQILAICAKHMKQRDALKNNMVVSTVMSNVGLGAALKEMEIIHVLTDVGDRHVVQKMLASGAVLGGEDSGHMIFLNHHTTGDGIISALQLLSIMQAESKPLSELSRIMTVFPQTLINVEVKRKPDIDTVAGIRDVIQSVEKKLGEKGRVLVRYSGTQSLCRVMVEGPSDSEIQQYCRQIAATVSKEIG